MAIPKAEETEENYIPFASVGTGKEEKIVFSFQALDKNEYFNLDGTCQNWAADLFDALKVVSDIKLSSIYAGEYTGRQSTLRIHQHKEIEPPCDLPKRVDIKEMWQIRISKSKGGIHGLFIENVFFVIWMDPQHNLYPDKNHGGLKKIKPPSTCCKERDIEIDRWRKKYEELLREHEAAVALLNEK